MAHETTDIGILLGERAYRALERRSGRKAGGKGAERGANERISLYERAAAEAGARPIYFSLRRMRLAKGTIEGIRRTNGRYARVRAGLPRAVHNRAFPASSRDRQALKRLARRAQVFNPRPRIPKYEVHRRLRARFDRWLPETKAYSKGALLELMRRYGDVFAKPQRGSVGRGVASVKRTSSGRWDVRLPGGKRRRMSFASAAAAIDRLARGRSYIVQRGIELARWRGRPFDFRVSVQRDGTGEWQVTGMFGRVAKAGGRVTNLGRGGRAMRASALLGPSFAKPGDVAAAIERLSLDVARYAGDRWPGLADLGLDVGVDAGGAPYLIELNCRDQRYGFEKAGMPAAFRRTYENPVRYAKFLADGGRPPRTRSGSNGNA